jgi:hypothetical protein
MVTDTTDVLPMMPKHLKKLPTQVKKLLTNVTYVLIVIFLAMDDDIIITSLATFMPKYAESQYQITPSTSALLVGGLTVVTPCLGSGDSVPW